MDNFRFEKSVPAVETEGLDEEIRYLERIESRVPRTVRSAVLLFERGPT